MTEQQIGKEYLENSIKAFQNMKSMTEKALSQLEPEDYRWQPDPESNSILILIKHIGGNLISRWTDFLTTDGEKKDRNRDSEFEDKNATLEQVMARWEKGWNTLFQTLAGLSEQDLLRTVYIRDEPHSVVKAIHRQLTHYSAHIGQILYIAKHRKGSDWKTLSLPRAKPKV
jgi:Protein of unknown function (DUF1572)